MNSRGILVIGASGYIGSHLVPRLLREKRPVRAAARNLEVLEARGWKGPELVAVDALRPDTLARALCGIDTAYYLIHSMASGRHFQQLDAKAAVNFRIAAENAGVRRIIYLGGLMPETSKSTHLRSRRETGQLLRSKVVQLVEVRAGMIIGPGSAAFEVIRDLVNYLPVMITPQWVRSRSTPIALEDLLQYLVAVCDLELVGHQAFDVGGPDIVSYEEIMRAYARIVGRHPIIVPVPVLTPKLSSYWLRLVTAVPTNIARALIEGLEHDIIANDSDIRGRVQVERHNLTESIELALQAEREHVVTARWVEGSMIGRGYESRYAFYAKKATASAVSSAAPTTVWQQIARIGNRGDYYFLNVLWTIRRIADWLIGGPSYRRGRRHPAELRVGDTIDAWRVIAMEPNRRLTLYMDMKAPGSGVLEFTVKPTRNGGTEIRVSAYWHPAGIWGLLYWYPLFPFHTLLFRGMSREIARRAESRKNSAG